MMLDEKTELQLQTLNRPIQCIIAKENRAQRLEGLTTVRKQLQGMPDSAVLSIMEKSALAKNLQHALEDEIENHRKTALEILERYLRAVKTQPNFDKDVLEGLLKRLLQRITGAPKEQSEELKMIIVERLSDFLPFNQQLISNISELCNAFARLAADLSPELKQAVCPTICAFARELRFNIGHHSAELIKVLAVNLTHQQFKVRKAAIEALGGLLVTEGCGQNMQFVQSSLKASLFDPKNVVRKAAYECISRLLNGFSVKNLKSYEELLVGYLLNGLSDESAEIAAYTMDLLDEVGRKR